MPRSRRIRRAIFSGGVLSLAALSLAGFAGYRAIFGRTAEGALALIPSDAKAIFLVDLAPLDPGQAMVFRQIDGSLDETGLTKMINEGFMSINGNHSATAAKMAPYLRRSGAVALFDEKQEEGVALIGLSDPVAVQSILQKEGKPQFWKGLRYWTLAEGGKAGLRVQGNWLVLAPNGSSLFRLRRVEEGLEASAATNPEIQAARTSLGGASNLEVLVSPSMIPPSEKMPKPMGWFACAGEVRDTGFALRTRFRIDPASAGEYADLLKTSPLSSQLLAQLPSGAYGVLSMSQIGRSLEAGKKEITLTDNDRRSMVEAVGIDLDQDLIPALKGDSTLAAYPDAAGSGIDGLLVIDDSHGANPGSAVKKFREHITETVEHQEGKTPFMAVNIEGAEEAWRIVPEFEKDMRNTGNGSTPFDLDLVMREKTAIWAIADGRVLASTNEALLRRAVAERSGKGLASEPLFADAFAGSNQYAFAADPSRIAGGIRKTLKMNKLSAEERKTTDNVLGIFEGLKDPLAMKMGIQPDGTFTSEVIVPMDWSKMIRFFGEMANK
ncbi:hypothetical protein EON81_10085 [bacterium]|nr:MAG: hypothetical protein EON81_10085 [bacterium]